ncbi:MAG: hybrid sensor histidine kinase/response regulator [Polyangiaceae bacterium]
MLVLYVDDDHSNRVVFEHSFRGQFSLITAPSAEEALALLEERDVGVLVTDQRMPGMSGNELLEEVKQRWPEIVRVVITAYSDLDAILKAINDGLVARYVVKPWDREELTGLLEWACEVHLLGRRDQAVKAHLLNTERLAVVGSLTAGALHDLSTPLSSLLTNSEVLRRYAHAVPAIAELAKAHAYTLVKSERQRLQELVRDLPLLADDMFETAEVAVGIVRQMAGLVAGRSGSEEQAVADPVVITRHVMSLCRRELPKGARVAYVGPQPLPHVRITPTDLTRVLLNLLMNAAQALRRTDRVAPGTIEVDAVMTATSVSIVVSDDGPGMSPDVLDKATKEFFTTRVDGSGLGLTQCRRLTERAGGTLKLESRQGQGVRVTVMLPRLDVVKEPATRDAG